MNDALFLRRNKPDWVRLEAFAARLDGRGAPLSGGDLFTFISLYRKVSGDLARARTLGARAEVVEYLNHLVGQVHLRVYAPPPYRFRRILDFYRETLPRTVRRLWKYVMAAALLLVVPAAATYLAVRGNPPLATAFTPPGYAEKVEEMFGGSFGKEGRSSGMGAIMTSFYIWNNVQVSFLAFAIGIFLGAGTVCVLAFNGMILGGVAAVIDQYGLTYNFWSFVASHGGIELGAIVLSGAAGLRVGLSFLAPGLLTRRDALVAGAKDAGLVMFGVITLLVVAALLEAFVSPSTLANPVKLALGAVNLAGFVAYFTFAGRGGHAPGEGSASA